MTTTTTDPGTIIASAATSLNLGLVQLIGAAVILAIVAVTIAVIWHWIRR
jgi:hypothetical protein